MPDIRTSDIACHHDDIAHPLYGHLFYDGCNLDRASGALSFVRKGWRRGVWGVSRSAHETHYLGGAACDGYRIDLRVSALFSANAG